jgi:hypothetical protein
MIHRSLSTTRASSSHDGSGLDVAARRNLVDLLSVRSQAPWLATDREVEHRQITNPSRPPKSDRVGPPLLNLFCKLWTSATSFGSVASTRVRTAAWTVGHPNGAPDTWSVSSHPVRLNRLIRRRPTFRPASAGPSVSSCGPVDAPTIGRPAALLSPAGQQKKIWRCDTL